MSDALIIHKNAVTTALAAEASAAIGTADLVWIHAQAGVGAGPAAIATYSAIPESARIALLAQETRPRFDVMDGGAIINLRGIGTRVDARGDALVSVRMWVSKGLVVSVAFNPLAGLDAVLALARAGKLHDPGDVVSAVADATTDALDPEIAKLGDQLDYIEERLDSAARPLHLRRRVAPVRSMAIQYRRFVTPQRIAIERLATADFDWIDAQDRAKLRTAADRCARMAEELESVRERAAIVHDELTDLRAEKLDARSLQIAIIATIFLPLTFLTGLLGMNVGGIPYTSHPHGFWYISGFCVLVALVTTTWFYWRHWPAKDKD